MLEEFHLAYPQLLADRSLDLYVKPLRITGEWSILRRDMIQMNHDKQTNFAGTTSVAAAWPSRGLGHKHALPGRCAR